MSSTSASEDDSRAGLKFRCVCVAIIVDPTTDKIMMVTSRKHRTKWIFPKGGLEPGETLIEAAIREAHEEGGTPLDVHPRNTEEVYCASSRSGDGEREVEYHIFEVEVTPDTLCAEWQEQHQRDRAWFTVPECLRKCSEWHNEKNTKEELITGFEMTSVYSRWKESHGGVDGDEEVGGHGIAIQNANGR